MYRSRMRFSATQSTFNNRRIKLNLNLDLSKQKNKQALLDASSSPYARHLASASLLKTITETNLE